MSPPRTPASGWSASPLLALGAESSTAGSDASSTALQHAAGEALCASSGGAEAPATLAAGRTGTTSAVAPSASACSLSASGTAGRARFTDAGPGSAGSAACSQSSGLASLLPSATSADTSPSCPGFASGRLLLAPRPQGGGGACGGSTTGAARAPSCAGTGAHPFGRAASSIAAKPGAPFPAVTASSQGPVDPSPAARMSLSTESGVLWEAISKGPAASPETTGGVSPSLVAALSSRDATVSHADATSATPLYDWPARTPGTIGATAACSGAAPPSPSAMAPPISLGSATPSG